MYRFWFALLFSCIALASRAQFVYRGAVDKYAVELLLDPYSDGVVNAVYAYDRFDRPIRISGRQSDSMLLLTERNSEAADTTTMRFDGGAIGADSLRGTWYNVRSGRRFDIRLALQRDLRADGSAYRDEAIIQDAELDSFYFRLLVSREAGQEPRVTGLRIHHKGDDPLLQELRVDCDFLGLGSISVGDYNFDGTPDFSLFEQGFAGPNTSSIYFLFDRSTKRYFRSAISGVSLEFDPVRRRITEVNQCCAGSQIQRTEYKLVNNRMQKTSEQCFKWNEKLQQLEERPLRECR